MSKVASLAFMICTCLKYNRNVNLTKRSQNCPTIKGTCTLYNIICFRNLTLFMVLVFKTKKMILHDHKVLHKVR